MRSARGDGRHGARRAAPQSAQERLQRAMALADTLGARAETLAGGDMVEAMVRHVRRHNITRRRPHPRQRPVAGGCRRPPCSTQPCRRAGWCRQLRRHAGRRLPGDRRDPAGRAPLPASAAPGRDPLTLARARRRTNAAAPLAGYAWALLRHRHGAVGAGLSGAAPDQYRHAVPAGGGGGGRQARTRSAALASVVSVGLFDFSSCSRWRPSRCRTCSTC